MRPLGESDLHADEHEAILVLIDEMDPKGLFA